MMKSFPSVKEIETGTFLWLPHTGVAIAITTFFFFFFASVVQFRGLNLFAQGLMEIYNLCNKETV